MTKSVLFFKVINYCFSESIKVSHCKELMSLEKRILKEESSLLVRQDYLREDQSLLMAL